MSQWIKAAVVAGVAMMSADAMACAMRISAPVVERAPQIAENVEVAPPVVVPQDLDALFADIDGTDEPEDEAAPIEDAEEIDTKEGKPQS